MSDNSRFYSFVANLYLSPIQCGIQTAHAVSEMSVKYHPNTSMAGDAYFDWAREDKTIVILAATNHAGVLAAHEQLKVFAEKFELPVTIFHEDEQSMNGMATACGIVVPDRFYKVELTKPDYRNTSHDALTGYWTYTADDGSTKTYYLDSEEGQFVSFLKSFRLA